MVQFLGPGVPIFLVICGICMAVVVVVARIASMRAVIIGKTVLNRGGIL